MKILNILFGKGITIALKAILKQTLRVNNALGSHVICEQHLEPRIGYDTLWSRQGLHISSCIIAIFMFLLLILAGITGGVLVFYEMLPYALRIMPVHIIMGTLTLITDKIELLPLALYTGGIFSAAVTALCHRYSKEITGNNFFTKGISAVIITCSLIPNIIKDRNALCRDVIQTFQRDQLGAVIAGAVMLCLGAFCLWLCFAMHDGIYNEGNNIFVYICCAFAHVVLCFALMFCYKKVS